MRDNREVVLLVPPLPLSPTVSPPSKGGRFMENQSPTSTSGVTLCPLCHRRAPDTNMQFKYEVNRRYNRGGYYTWDTKSLAVPVCTTCRKWWKWANPFIFVPVCFILFLGGYYFDKSTGSDVGFFVGTALFAIVLLCGGVAYLVRGQKIKKWMKDHMPDITISGIPH